MSLNEVLSFASNRCTLHPAEALSFYVKVDLSQTHEGEQILITFPQGFRIENYCIEGEDGKPEDIWVVDQQGETKLYWSFEDERRTQSTVLAIEATVNKDVPKKVLVCTAELLNADAEATFQVNYCIQVNRKADSMRFLPEIYHDDDFLNRFMLLIDSFWKPISQQIDQVSNYVDPSMAPERFVDWMAEWFGMSLDLDLSEDLKRKIVAKIGPILATKGTKQAMLQLLRLYSGGTVEITEHMDSNFMIGPSTQLGYQIALGTQNKPNSFDIYMNVPTPLGIQAKDPSYTTQFRRKIESIIEMCKPAHTFYKLEIKFID